MDRFIAARRYERYPDTLPTLASLAGTPLAVVTNGASTVQRDKLAATGLADSGQARPRTIPHGARAVGVEPHEALMIGDNPVNDIQGARAIGIEARRIDRVAGETLLDVLG